MGISSLGAGSSILTQDVLDQLRAADETAKIAPLTTKINNENTKKDELEVLDANMTNLIDSITAITSVDLFDERSVTTTGTSVEVSAAAGSDIQDFTLNVTNLATKQIEESGSFSSENDLVGGGTGGQINLNIDGQDFAIDYTDTTTLGQLKDLINQVAGDSVDATILNVGTGDARLVISSANTGSTQDITITDVSGTIDSKLTSGMNVLQPGIDAQFTFNNGSTITRSSNEITDLITGYTITLKEAGETSVSVAQNTDTITEKLNNFVSKYNDTMTELSKITKSSTDAADRGIFSNDSIIKGLQSTVRSMIESVGGGVGSLIDYGFDIDKEGVMTFNQDTFLTALNDNPDNVQAFFNGGDFTNADTSVTTVTGAFNEIATIVEGYTDYNAILDTFKTNLTDNISTLEDRKATEIERLDSKYEIMKKKFAAYDLMISKFNSISSMFADMVSSQNSSSN
ncbi:MAG: flagellar filament capping protein FliD [Sulfurimonas sp.]